MSYQLGDTMSFTRGAHDLKWGFHIYRVQLDRKSTNTSTVTYTSIQDFINNSAFSASQTVGNPGTATRGYHYGAFAQDTWHARRNLTLDYGLRWDYDAPPFDPGNHQQTFNLATNTLAPPGTEIFHPNKADFSRRFGVAWQVGPRPGLAPTSSLIIFLETRTSRALRSQPSVVRSPRFSPRALSLSRP